MSSSTGSPSPLTCTISLDKPMTTTTSTLSTGILDLHSFTGLSASSTSPTSSDSGSTAFSDLDLVLSDIEIFLDQSDKDSGEEGKLPDSEDAEKNEEI